MRGVKVTGDPNVPFDKTTFEIDVPGCLDIPLEEQQSCGALEQFLHEPKYLDYQVPHIPSHLWIFFLFLCRRDLFLISQCQGIFGKIMELMPPLARFIVSKTYLLVALAQLILTINEMYQKQGRWSCKCQVAGHGYMQPSFIPGILADLESVF